MAVEFDVGTGEDQSPYYQRNRTLVSEWERAAEELDFSLNGSCNAWRLEMELSGNYREQPISIQVKHRHDNVQNGIFPVNNRVISKMSIHLRSNAGRPPFKVSTKKGWMLGKRVITIIEPDWFYITGGSIHENQLNDLRNWMLDWKDHGLVEVVKKSNEQVKVEMNGILRSSKDIVQMINDLKRVFIH